MMQMFLLLFLGEIYMPSSCTSNETRSPKLVSQIHLERIADAVYKFTADAFSWQGEESFNDGIHLQAYGG